MTTPTPASNTPTPTDNTPTPTSNTPTPADLIPLRHGFTATLYRDLEVKALRQAGRCGTRDAVTGLLCPRPAGQCPDHTYRRN